MSTLRGTIELLRRQVLSAPPRRFAGAAQRRPALGAHGELQSVLRALADESEAAYPAREALSLALIQEHRETGDTLWSSVLLLAYYPMLSRLRHRLVTTTLSREELDQVVLAAFLTTVDEVPLHKDRLPMRLRQRTERQVFQVLRRERGEYAPLASAEELARLACDPSEGRRFVDTHDGLMDLALLLGRAEARGQLSGLEVVEATVFGREELRNYVERLVPEDEGERERTYQRLKRQRSRAMSRLKSLARASRVSPKRAFAPL